MSSSEDGAFMNKILKKLFKILKLIIVGLLSIVIVFISFSEINNKIQLNKESKILTPPGNLVKVNNKNLHIYAEGDGNITCVFMPGLGNVAPIVEMKGLYKNMSNDYRIAVVDRLGYGFSDNSDDSRDIDTILEETRKALVLAGEKPPYVLFPHSVSGIEATYWAQKYPEEVKAIIGLDISYPDVYLKAYTDPKEVSKIKSNLSMIKKMSWLVKLGIHRLLPSMYLEQAILDSDYLSEDDKNLYKALTYKKLLNKDVISESRSIEANSKKSMALGLPTKTPICAFIATPLTEEERSKKSENLNKRIDLFNEYLARFEKGKMILVPGKHSIYLYSPEKIAEESKEFIRSINN